MRTLIPAKALLAVAILFGTATTSMNALAQTTAPREPVVSTAWLESHLHDPGLVLLQVGNPSEYRTAHIPGARFVRLEDVSARSGKLTLELPNAQELRQQLQVLGISDGSHIVVYFGNEEVSVSTRVLFALLSAGLGANSDLLDGGLPKWRREGRNLSNQTPAAARPGTLAPFQLRPTVVDADFVRTHVGQPGYALIDARAAMYYDGIEKSGADGHEQRGHIPGARNLPFTSVANDDLTLKQPAELLALFRKAGVKPGDKVIAYCHIGQQGTAVLLAARIAGIDAVLYDGSFEDWTLRGLPVEI